MKNLIVLFMMTLIITSCGIPKKEIIEITNLHYQYPENNGVPTMVADGIISSDQNEGYNSAGGTIYFFVDSVEITQMPDKLRAIILKNDSVRIQALLLTYSDGRRSIERVMKKP